MFPALAGWFFITSNTWEAWYLQYVETIIICMHMSSLLVFVFFYTLASPFSLLLMLNQANKHLRRIYNTLLDTRNTKQKYKNNYMFNELLEKTWSWKVCTHS